MVQKKKVTDWNQEERNVEEKLRQWQEQQRLEDFKRINFGEQILTSQKNKNTNNNNNNNNNMNNGLKLSLIIISCCLVLGIISWLGYSGMTGLVVYNTNDEATFNLGTYSGVYYNSTTGPVLLNLTEGFTNGHYLSNIFNADSLTTWNNLSLSTSAWGELPNSLNTTETTWNSGNLDMTYVWGLYHLNNDSALGESSTKIRDFSLNGRNGTITAKAAKANLTNKKLGAGSYYFNGSGNYISVGPTENWINTNFTVMAWIYLDSYSDGTNYAKIVFGRHTSASTKCVELGINYSSGLFLHNIYTLCNGNENLLLSPQPASLKTWYHVAWTLDYGRNRTIFVNGTKVVSDTTATTVGSCAVQSYIGYNGRTAGREFNGLIDELVVFKRVLTDQEIKDHYQRTATRFNVTTRSCNDALCDTETWTDVNDSSPQQLATGYSIPNNQYFQYNVSLESDDINYSPYLYNVSIDYTPTIKPNVTTLIPTVNSNYNLTNIIEIAANVTDNSGVSKVFANVTYPNGTINQLTLTNGSGYNDKFNVSFTIPELTGVYNITYIANDTTNNINSSEKSNFTVKIGCATLTTSQTMSQNLTSAGTCFTINTNDTTLDCAEYEINYSSDGTIGYGITTGSNIDNITIQNCIIVEGKSANDGKHGVLVPSGGINITIYNNTITTIGIGSSAISVPRGDSINISTNTITTSGELANGINSSESLNNSNLDYNIILNQGISSSGILISNGEYNNFTSNLITSDGSDSFGIVVNTLLDYSTINLNNITMSGAVDADDVNALYLDGTGNTITNNIFEASGEGSTAAYILGSEHSFSNDLIQNSPSALLLEATNTNFTGTRFIDNTDNSIFLNGAEDCVFTNVIVNTTSDDGVDGTVVIVDSLNNIFEGMEINHAPSFGIMLSGITTNSTGNIFRNGRFYNNSVGITIQETLGDGAKNNLFLNNNFTDMQSYLIQDFITNSQNKLIYNNSYGEIVWTNTTFLTNLTIKTNNGNFKLGQEIYIANNTIALNTSHFSEGMINSSANITLTGIGLSAVNRIMKVSNYTTSTTDIQTHGTDCIAAGTCWNLSYSGGTLLFNTTSFSSFSANESAAGGGGNTLPTAPVLLTPANNSYTTNRTPEFRWNNSYDAESDSLTYNLVIDDNPTFNNPEVNTTQIAEGTLNTSKAITTELNVDTTYYWKVAANDSTGYGAWSGTSNLTVQSYLLITLTTNSVAFGSMTIGEKNDTTDNAPPPFTAVNGGNILANVTITGTSYFSSAGFPGNYFQFKIRANESSAFETVNSNLTFINMTDTYSGYHVRGLDWRDVNDDFLVDLNITVPVSEPPGAKSSTITFTMEAG